jgi:phosphoribosylformylglycinamidine synthase
MWKANIYVTLKEGVLDPQGQAVLGSLKQLGFSTLQEVKVGKFLVVDLAAESMALAVEQVEAMCKRLLANPVIEDYRYDLMEVAQ